MASGEKFHDLFVNLIKCSLNPIYFHQKRDEKIVVAVKTLTSDSDSTNRVNFLREAAINGQFRHGNVVRLHGVVTIGSPVTTFRSIAATIN